MGISHPHGKGNTQSRAVRFTSIHFNEVIAALQKSREHNSGRYEIDQCGNNLQLSIDIVVFMLCRHYILLK